MPDRSTMESKTVEAYLQYLATGELPVNEHAAERRRELEVRIEKEEKLHLKVQLIAQLYALDAPRWTAQQLEDRFVEYGTTFGARTHVTYKAWRSMGVPPKVLKRMGLQGDSTGPRDPNRPKQTRNRVTPEHAHNVFRAWQEGGQDLVTSTYGFASHYATTLLRDLWRRYPDIAAEHGYDHSAEVGKNMARNAAAARLHKARQAEAS